MLPAQPPLAGWLTEREPSLDNGTTMNRHLAAWFGPLCALALLVFCYRSAILEGGQYGYRDAAHFYYPLYQKVQAEWAAGHVPLWDTSENAGMPLLGNPTAAVLYPGKLIFALFSYPRAVRWYAVAHSALAFAGVWVLLRSWNGSRAAASLAGLSYAFGAPVLFQYCNIIYLVGAAWIPWGFWAVDRWLRLGRWSGVLILAVVLAMQVLGGDPESAYLIGLCAGGYAILLVRERQRSRQPARQRSLGWMAGMVALTLTGLVVWVALSLAAAAWLPGLRHLPGEASWGAFGRWFASGHLPRFRKTAYTGPVPGFAWVGPLPILIAAAWGLVGLIWLARWRRLGSTKVPVVPMLAGLVASATLAGLLTAAQLLPVAEFTGISGRATDEGPHDSYPFSLEPYRIVELVWPGFFGRNFGGSVAWMGMILPGVNHRIWVPSLYLGGLTLIFAFAALGRGQRFVKTREIGEARPTCQPGLTWLAIIAVVALVASFGEFASPIWLARFVPGVAEWAGPHDSVNTNSVRLDGWLRDGDGSPYCLMSGLLPGFHSFRFPSKLFTFVALAMAGLAGMGWDRIMAEDRRGARRVAVIGLGASLIGLAVVIGAHGRLVDWFEGQNLATLFGPLDASGAVFDLALAFGQGALTFGSAVALMIWGRRRPGLADGLAIALMALDLGWANATMVRTVPQSDFEVVPEVLAHINEAERIDPSPGPYRIHRMPIWNPPGWRDADSGDRVRDFVQWEHATIQPKYGMLHGVEYTKTIGVAELYDYEWFFSPFPRSTVPEAARYLGITPGDKVVVYPRRGFDLWNSRYFILPFLHRWDDADRGVASFLPQTSRVYPPADQFQGPEGQAGQEEWARKHDYQILRNESAFPRAWVVHDVRFKPTIKGLNRAERDETMQELLFSDDPFWRDSQRTYFDPKILAWIETDDPSSLAGFVTRGNPTASETVTVDAQASDRVVLDATLDRPGMVILADVFYPGWTLTIDDQPAPIYRTNRLMRGAAVGSGRHRLVYSYQPKSFRVGAAISLAGVLVLLAGSIAVVRQSRRGS